MGKSDGNKTVRVRLTKRLLIHENTPPWLSQGTHTRSRGADAPFVLARPRGVAAERAAVRPTLCTAHTHARGPHAGGAPSLRWTQLYAHARQRISMASLQPGGLHGSIALAQSMVHAYSLSRCTLRSNIMFSCCPPGTLCNRHHSRYSRLEPRRMGPAPDLWGAVSAPQPNPPCTRSPLCARAPHCSLTHSPSSRCLWCLHA